MRLEHILVTDEQFVATYPTGLRDLQDWEFAWSQYNKKKTPRRKKDGRVAGVARLLENRSCQTVYQWLVKGFIPPALTYLSRSKKIGLMPFGLDNEKFLYINKYLSYVFWTGSIGKKYQVSVSLKKRLGKSLNNMLRRKLRINSKYIPHNDVSGSVDCNKNGPFYARVFQQLGLPVGGGRKASQFFEIPDYIRKLTAIVADDGKNEYRTIARKALEDFALVLFKTRKYISNSSDYWSIALHCNKKKEIAKKLGEDMIDIFRTLFPKSGITKRNLGKKLLHHKKRNNWNSRIYLKQANLQRLEQHYPRFYERIDDGKI